MTIDEAWFKLARYCDIWTLTIHKAGETMWSVTVSFGKPDGIVGAETSYGRTIEQAIDSLVQNKLGRVE